MWKWFLALGFLPATVLAVDFTDVSSQYTDAPFPKDEALAISVLTNLGVIEGNPDGSFRNTRGLNRAEYAKIIVVLSGEQLDAPSSCFPDVSAEDWFSTYVCTAKRIGIVQGNPDGLFHPDRSVNYAEAITILARLFYGEELSQYEEDRQQWYNAPMQAAFAHGTAVFELPDPSMPLSRGDMALMAATFQAEEDNQLLEFTLRANNAYSSMSSSTSSVQSSSSESSSSSSSLDFFDPEESPPAEGVGIQNQLLMLGRKTPRMAEAVFTTSQDAYIRMIELRLQKKVDSFQHLYIVNKEGEEIAELKLVKTNNDNDTKWEFSSSESLDALFIPGGTDVALGLVAQLRPRGDGKSGELIELEEWKMVVQTVETVESKSIVPVSLDSAIHQTTLAIVTSVDSSMPGGNVVSPGSNRSIGTFSVEADVVEGARLKINELVFLVDLDGIEITQYQLRRAGTLVQNFCGREGSNPLFVVSCPVISDEMGASEEGLISFELLADISIKNPDSDKAIEVAFDDPGAFGVNGAVRWSDGTVNFSWVPLNPPLAGTIKLTVE